MIASVVPILINEMKYRNFDEIFVTGCTDENCWILIEIYFQGSKWQ